MSVPRARKPRNLRAAPGTSQFRAAGYEWDPATSPTVTRTPISCREDAPASQSSSYPTPQTPSSSSSSTIQPLASPFTHYSLGNHDSGVFADYPDTLFPPPPPELLSWDPFMFFSPEQKHKPARTAIETAVETAIAALREAYLSPFDLLLRVYGKDSPYVHFRNELGKQTSTQIAALLDLFMKDEKFKCHVQSWMLPHALELMKNVVSDEVESFAAATSVPEGTASITPYFIDTWSVKDTSSRTPRLTDILSAAAQTRRAEENNTKKNPERVLNSVIRQLSYSRSGRSLQYQTMYGLLLWSTGCSEQTIDALHQCGISVSYSGIRTALGHLSSSCLDLARATSRTLHVFCYDNVNISTSNHITQRGQDTPTKVQSGTFALLYPAGNADPRHMLVKPIMERFHSAPPFEFERDLQPTLSQLTSLNSQFIVIIADVLFNYQTGFSVQLRKHSFFQHSQRRCLPNGYRTSQYPIPASTIEEATVKGNLRFQDHIYIDTFKLTEEELSIYIIICIHDQLTLARNRTAMILRSQDLNPWTRREIFMLGFGLFHACQTLIWALLNVHRGALHQAGSLTYFFAVMEKTRLGGAKPDYYALLSALTQILEGLILNAWRQEAGNLAAFAASHPSPNVVYDLAEKILNKYTVPLERHYISRKDRKKKPAAGTAASQRTRAPSPGPSTDGSSASDEENEDDDPFTKPKPNSSPNPLDDIIHQNLVLLTRDLMYVRELIRAVADGDIGRVDDMLPQLAMIYRGAGSVNYAMEMLHFIYNLKHVWTPEFANIMLDNMIVSFTGIPGQAMGRDMNIEHLIRELKNLLTVKGLQSTWEQLGDISGAIDYIRKIKNKFASEISTAYQGTTHTTPDTKPLVWKIANKVRDERFQYFTPSREGNTKAKETTDAMLSGRTKLENGTVEAFNKKIAGMRRGHIVEDELDTLGLPEYGEPAATGGAEGQDVG